MQNYAFFDCCTIPKYGDILNNATERCLSLHPVPVVTVFCFACQNAVSLWSEQCGRVAISVNLLSNFTDFALQFHWFCSAISLILLSNFTEFTELAQPNGNTDAVFWQAKKGSPTERRQTHTCRWEEAWQQTIPIVRYQQPRNEGLHIPNNEDFSQWRCLRESRFGFFS